MTVMEFRARTAQPDDLMDERWQKLAVDTDYSLLLSGEVRLLKPNGKLLAHYVPGAFRGRTDDFYDTLHELRKNETGNRGYASGTQALPAFEGATRMRTVPIASAIIGAFDAQPPKYYCRLTAWTAKEFKGKWPGLFPLFEDIGALFAEKVPDRYAVQMQYVQQTHPDWVVEGTPFSTITVNNSYPTGYHTDKGDLDEGFSCLTVLRKGNYSGGRLVFPEYRVAVDMQDGDQLFMDAHAAHGNTQLLCGDCGVPMGPGAGLNYSHERLGCTAERISIVSYYRTMMKECGSAEEEQAKAQEWGEKRAAINENRILEDMAVESAVN